MSCCSATQATMETNAAYAKELEEEFDERVIDVDAKINCFTTLFMKKCILTPMDRGNMLFNKKNIEDINKIVTAEVVFISLCIITLIVLCVLQYAFYIPIFFDN